LLHFVTGCNTRRQQKWGRLLQGVTKKVNGKIEEKGAIPADLIKAGKFYYKFEI
jgi:hypothetical protein